jgi:hypothetical protein
VASKSAKFRTPPQRVPGNGRWKPCRPEQKQVKQAVAARTSLLQNELKQFCATAGEDAYEIITVSLVTARRALLEERFQKFRDAVSKMITRHHAQLLALGRKYPGGKPADIWATSLANKLLFVEGGLVARYSDDFVRSACHGPGYKFDLFVSEDLHVQNGRAAYRRLPQWADPSWDQRLTMRGFRTPFDGNHDAAVSKNSDAGDQLLTLKDSYKLLRRYRHLLADAVRDGLRSAELEHTAVLPLASGAGHEASRTAAEEPRGPYTFSAGTATPRRLPAYRSGLKREIARGLSNNPTITDLDLCRWLDEQGTECPWDRNGDRLFESLYRDNEHKPKIESLISKVRRDMRSAGLLSL